MTQEQLRMQMLAGIITERQYKKITSVLTEEQTDNNFTFSETNGTQMPKDELIQQLIALVSTGEIDNEGIKDINYQLISARRKMFASKVSPEARKAAAAKATATKEREKTEKAARDQAFRNLGIGNDDRGSADEFALSLNLHRNKTLQKQFNDEVNKLLGK